MNLKFYYQSKEEKSKLLKISEKSTKYFLTLKVVKGLEDKK